MKLYNTLSSQKEDFVSQTPGKVNFYTCGPTVYNFAHIGNLRTFMFEDILRRWLIHEGYLVYQVKNLTDVDDKIIRASSETNTSVEALTSKFTQAFLEDIYSLRIQSAEVYPKATDHIPEMIRLIQELILKDYAYVRPSGVYFRAEMANKFPQFVNPENLEAGASGRINLEKTDKINPADFALWKSWTANDGQVFWNAPWGKGRPGWHIECSAMALKHLSRSFEEGWNPEKFQTIDVHTGGIDLQFPHHQCEIAQTEACVDKRFANYWLHAAHLLVDGQKMAKSLGNFYTIRDILNLGYHPLALRYLLFSAHYRQPLNFTLESLKAATQAVQRINDFYADLLFCIEDNLPEGKHLKEIEQLSDNLQKTFNDHMNDDLHLPKALSEIFDFMNLTNSRFNSRMGKPEAEHIISALNDINSVLDIITTKQILTSEAKKLLADRIEFRKTKNWKQADEIRTGLRKLGIAVEDRPSGQKWKYIFPEPNNIKV